MKYGIIDASTPKILTERVGEMIGKGWKPLGGPVATGGGLLQAMTLEEE